MHRGRDPGPKAVTSDLAETRARRIGTVRGSARVYPGGTRAQLCASSSAKRCGGLLFAWLACVCDAPKPYIA